MPIPLNFSTPQRCYNGFFCPRGSTTPEGTGACPSGYFCPTQVLAVACPPGGNCPCFFSLLTGLVQVIIVLASATCSLESATRAHGNNSRDSRTVRSVQLGTFVLGGHARPQKLALLDLSAIHLVSQCPCYPVRQATGPLPASRTTALAVCGSQNRVAVPYALIGPWTLVSCCRCAEGTMTSDPSDPIIQRPTPCPPGTFCLGGVAHNLTIPWIPADPNGVSAPHECIEGSICREATPTTSGSSRCKFQSRIQLLGASGDTTSNAGYEGHYCPPGTSSPIQVPLGSFSSDTGAVAPTTCFPGLYAPLTATIECAVCPAGYSLVTRVWQFREILVHSSFCFSQLSGIWHIRTRNMSRGQVSLSRRLRHMPTLPHRHLFHL